MRHKQIAGVGVLLLLGVLLGWPLRALAQTYTSPHYGVTEVQFGSGGGNATSSQYQSQTDLGTNGAGNTSSTNFRADAGFVTPNAPYLEMHVTATTINLGTLSPSSTSTGTGTFSVRAYLAGSYAVYTVSDPPTSESGAILKPMTSQAASSSGSEQFGINLVANTSPASFGANPVNVPDNTYADGQAATGYSTPNQFKYNKGDVIATSPKTTGNQAAGETDYTISYIANINVITKAGLYTMAHSIVAVATY